MAYGKFKKIFKEEIIADYANSFGKHEKRDLEASITTYENQTKTLEEKYRPLYLTSVDTKILYKNFSYSNPTINKKENTL